MSQEEISAAPVKARLDALMTHFGLPLSTNQKGNFV